MCRSSESESTRQEERIGVSLARWFFRFSVKESVGVLAARLGVFYQRGRVTYSFSAIFFVFISVHSVTI